MKEFKKKAISLVFAFVLVFLFSMLFDDTKEKAESHYRKGTWYQRDKQYDYAQKHLKQSLAFYKKLNKPNKMAEILYRLANIADRQKKYYPAQRHLQKSLKIYQKLKQKKNIAKVHYRLGILNKKQNKYERAKKYYWQSLKVYREIGMSGNVADAYCQLGIVNKRQKNYDLAKKYYTESLKIYQGLKKPKNIAILYENLGFVAELTEYDKAKKYYEQSLNIYRELNRPFGIARINFNLGYLANKYKKRDLARKYYKESLFGYQKLGAVSDVADVLYNLGFTARKQKKYSLAAKYYQQSLEIYEKQGALSDVASTYEALAQMAKNQYFYKKAEIYYQKSLAKYQKLGWQSNIGDIYYELGNLAYNYRDYNNMKEYYSKAQRHYLNSLTFFRKSNKQSSIAYVYNKLGFISSRIGNYEKSKEYYQQGLALYKKLNSLSDMALSHMNIGIIAGEQNNYKQMREHMLQSLGIYQKLNDSQNILAVLENMALLEQLYGNFSRSQNYYKQMQKFDQIASLYGLGDLLHVQRKYAKAIEALQKGLEIARKSKDQINISRGFFILAVVMQSQREYEKAKKYYIQSLDLQKSPQRIPVLLNNLGRLAFSQGNYAEASRYYRRALKMENNFNSPVLSLLLINLGNLAHKQKQYNKAQYFYQRALQVLRQLHRPDDVAKVLWSMGALAQSRQQPYRAQHFYQKTLKAFVKMHDYFGVALTLGSLGDLATSKGQLSEGYRYYLAALVHYQRLLDTSSNPFARLRLASEKQVDLQQGLLRCLGKMVKRGESNFAQLYKTFEETRGRFRAALAEARLPVYPGIPKQIFTKEKDLAQQRAQLHTMLVKAYGQKNLDFKYIKSLETKRVELSEKFHNLRQKILQQYPTYAALRHRSSLDLFQLKKLLPKDWGLLSYATQAGFMFLVTDKTEKLHPLEPLRSLDAIFPLLQKATWNDSDHKKFTSIAHGLYKKLIEPFATSLAQEGISHLVIVADGKLQHLPFGILLQSKPEGSMKNWPFLLKEYTLSYSSSGTLLHFLAQKKGVKPSKKLLAIGDSRYPHVKTLQQNARGARWANRWSPLPATRREIHAASNAFGNKGTLLLEQKQACESQFKSIALQDYRYIHFAVHGFVAPNPRLCSLVISTIPDGKEDGYLWLEEIYQLRLNADAVVLSACETALGKEEGGEGMLGISRAFHFAGSRGVVASLWKVPDDNTAHLMTSFYKKLAGGSPACKALQTAQSKMIEQELPPYHWAAWVFSGWDRAPRQIPAPSKFPPMRKYYIKKLVRTLDTPDEKLRGLSRELLALLTKEDVKWLIETLPDQNSLVQEEMTMALGEIGGKDVLTALPRLYDQKSTHLAAAISLFRLGDQRGKALLKEKLVSGEKTVDIAPLFWQSNSQLAIKGITTALFAKSLQIRYQATRYMGKILDDWEKDTKFIYIPLLLYDLHLKAPSAEDARKWSQHFRLDRFQNCVVLTGTKKLLNANSYKMIPGFHLIDKNFILRSDSAGHFPLHNLYSHLFPRIPKLLNEKIVFKENKQKISDFSIWPKVGKAYPDLLLKDQNGKDVQLSSFKGKVILLELIGMSCPACQAFSGAHKLGSYGGVTPQADILAVEEDVPWLIRAKKAKQKNMDIKWIKSALLRQLQDPSPAVRKESIFALNKLGEVDFLLDMILDPDKEVRNAVILALEETKLPSSQEKIIAKVLKLMGKSDTSRLFSLKALSVLFSKYKDLSSEDQSGELWKKLVFALSSPSAKIRQTAIKALGNCPWWEKQALPLLLKALSDRDKKVRQTALFTIFSFGRDAIDFLLPMLKSKDREQVTIAVEGLGNMGTIAQRTIPDLIKVMGVPSNKVRSKVHEALSLIGKANKNILPQLQKLLNSDKWRVRKKTLEVLEQMSVSNLDLQKKLQEMKVKDPELEVRFQAKKTLKKLFSKN